MPAGPRFPARSGPGPGRSRPRPRRRPAKAAPSPAGEATTAPEDSGRHDPALAGEAIDRRASEVDSVDQVLEGPAPTPQARDDLAAAEQPGRAADPGTAADSEAAAAFGFAAGTRGPARRRWRTDLTARALALAVVLLVLVISYASSLRIYLAQTRDLAETRATIAERQARISGLEDEVAQWDDTTYVRAQARARLGWVMPGETGFTVVGADGQPVGGGPAVGVEEPAAPAARSPWWVALWGSIQIADTPPKPAQPAPRPARSQPPITESTRPSGQSSPR